ncbi:hypothetical protein WICMUC_002899 [Wickerhamomyces mucosus]|uniref:Uncharacterized protein n=1 Tax=Wickerhamomyces mucosus TaxID=1378264 RepID=A0A9P8PNC4_9ASCO|nr:hypothetical protein WICMUC_002899 [Wickerhamomyces mucosus]
MKLGIIPLRSRFGMGLIRPSPFSKPNLFQVFRLNSNLTESSPTAKSNVKLKGETKLNHLPDHIRKTIPGETEQSNSIISRLPTFPLRNNSTLLPKPGVPMASDTPLRSMLEILTKKKKPELIYEAEPHKLYFLVCGILAFIFSIYGFTFTDWGFRAVWKIYEEDSDLLMLAGRIGLCTLISSVAVGIVYSALSLPTRLIRRIWYIPNKNDALIRFTSHPLLPGRATPVYTIRLSELNRSQRSKIFTKNGIYGTLDKSTFFFLIKERNKKFGYWIVDRNGWFWGDGRIFDILFGKESLEEASKGQTYNDKLKEVSDKLQSERQKLKDEHGVMWQAKVTSKMLKKDINEIVNIVSSTNQNKLGEEKQKELNTTKKRESH